MLGAFLSLSRPLAMQALSNPTILGSLLVGAVGSQQASEIQNQLNLGNISLDNVYDTIINFAASPAVSALRDTPSGQVLAPDEAQIEAERKFNEELNRKIFLPPEISIDQILSTPQTTTVPEPLITPDVPEEKVSVDDVGMTSAPAPKIGDMILTAKDTKYIKDKDKLDQIFEGQDNLFREGDYGDPKVYFETINVGYGSVPFYEAWEDDYQGGVADLGNPRAASKITEYPDYPEYKQMIQDYFRQNVGDEFVTYRLTTEEDAKKFLDTDVKSLRAKSFTLNPRQAISFAYFANEKFMNMDTYQPKDNLVLLEVPIKPEHLVMRGKSSEAEVVAKTNKINKSDIRVYNPYTGELIKDATTGFLQDSPLLDLGSNFVPTIKIKQNEETETIEPGQYTVKDTEAWLKKREEEFEKNKQNDITLTNEKTDTVRQGEGQTTIEALKTKSLQGENVDQGSSSDSRENVLKTEEGFEVANKALGIDFFTKVLTKEIAPPKKKYEPILDVSDIGNTFDVFQEKRTGDFENHIFTSIPTFQEAQIATADALIKTLPKNGSILDLGGTEGGFINTIAEQRPDVSGFIVDPNVVAQKMFNEQQMPNAYYIREAFTTDSSQFGKYAFDVEDENEIPIETNYFDFNIVDDNSLDAVTEKMTFQFIDKGRNNKIKLISEKLKPEGIALFEEKFFTSKDDPVWQANEAKKNEFKLNYYDQKDLTEKQKNILEGMDKHQVTSPEFEEILSKYFNNVVQYWDSGNFKGYVASDSADTINKFLNNLEDLNSEYSNVSTPRFVTDKIVEKRRGGSISLPQMNML